MSSATNKKAKAALPVPGMGRLAKYLDRVWGFSKLVRKLKDGRKNPPMPTASVFLGVFGMLSVRLGSLQSVVDAV